MQTRLAGLLLVLTACEVQHFAPKPRTGDDDGGADTAAAGNTGSAADTGSQSADAGSVADGSLPVDGLASDAGVASDAALASDAGVASDAGLDCSEPCDPWKTCKNGECVTKACKTDAECNAPGFEQHWCYQKTKTCQLYQCGTNADCPAGQLCTLDYLCIQPPSGCQWDGMCTDGDGCTIDECDLKTKTCTHTKAFGCCASAKDCDDGNTCTLDACKNGQCSHDGKPACCTVAAECGDGNPCTLDSCQGGACKFAPIANCCVADGSCDDGDELSVDVCWKNSCLHQWAGVPASCSQDADCKGNACLSGKCSAGKCGYAKAGSCCTGNTACQKDVACQLDACTAGVCAVSKASGQGTWVWRHCDDLTKDGWTIDKGNPDAYFHLDPGWAIAGKGLRFGQPGKVSYATGATAKGSATSAAFTVPKSSPALKFWVFLDVEPGTAVDACGVDVVAGGKATTVWSKAGNLGGGTTAQAWKPASANLQAWAGQSVQLRVWFDQKVQSQAGKAKVGFVVDEFEVQGSCP
jgi:hypothetical protein